MLASWDCELYLESCKNSGWIHGNSLRQMSQESTSIKYALFASYNKCYASNDCVVSVSGEGSTRCNGFVSIPHDVCTSLSFSFEVDEWLIGRNGNLFPSRMERTK